MVDPERDAHLDSVLIGGREPVTIVVADYDPDWLLRFESVRHRLRPALGPVAVDYLDLRDWLRVDRADRDLYSAVQRDLARRSWTDMNHDADAKTDVLRDLLERARAWRAAERAR